MVSKVVSLTAETREQTSSCIHAAMQETSSHLGRAAAPCSGASHALLLDTSPSERSHQVH